MPNNNVCWCIPYIKKEKGRSIFLFNNGEYFGACKELMIRPSTIETVLTKIGTAFFYDNRVLYTVDGVIVTKPKYFKDDRAIFVLVPMHGCFIHAPYGKVIVTEPQISDPKATKLASSAASLEERKPCIKSKSYESSSTLPEFKSSNDRLNKAVKKYVAGLVMDPCNENNSLQEPFGNI